jgi:gamma-glutamyl:cysteine ligase YbdK (ATP-grasp superfamily)
VETTLHHELVHVVVDTLGGGKTPRWLAEGIALHVAGEGKLIQQNAEGAVMSSDEIERKIASAKTSAEMKSAYAAAYQAVRNLIPVEGENKLWKRVAQRSYDGSTKL